MIDLEKLGEAGLAPAEEPLDVVEDIDGPDVDEDIGRTTRDDKVSLPDSESTTVEPVHSLHTHQSVITRFRSRVSRMDSKRTFIDFAHGDPDNPLNFSTRRKWFITILTVMMTILVAAAAGAYSPAMPNLMEEFGVSTEVVTLGISLYPLGCMPRCLICDSY